MGIGDDWMYAEMEERSRIPKPLSFAVEEAHREIQQEDYRKQVEAEKARIRARSNRTLWQRLFPWKLVRRDS